MKAFINADFISCEARNRVFSVLIEDKGRIVYTGDDIPERFAGAEKVDLAGGAVVPAFCDTHMHFESFALFGSTVDVRDAADFEDMGRMLREYAGRHRGVKLIPAYGCSAHTVKEGRLPDRADLDGMTGLPLLIVKYDGHAAVANSALIDQFPPQVRDDPGFDETTGWLYQNAFYLGVNFITAKIPILSVLRGMNDAGELLASRGIGFVHTVEGVGYKNDIDVDTMRFLRYGLSPSFRIYFQTMDVDKVVKRGMKGIGGCFSLALDGCFGSEDARLTEPYANDPQNLGFLAYTQEQVTEFCKKANRAGLQITMHAIGDAAVEQALNAYEAALADFPRKDCRHIIIHADLIPEALQERAAKLGLCVALQPNFLRWKQEPAEYLERILGARASEMLPLRSMLEKGILLSAGSDAPCTLPDPIEGIYNCCNHPDPEQSVSVLDALRMHTLYAAMTSHDERQRGSLREGLVADLAVLDGNPLEIEPAELRNIKVVDTYLAGKRFVPKKRGALGLVFRALHGYLSERELK